MKHTRLLLWGKRALAFLLCLAILLSVPLQGVFAEPLFTAASADVSVSGTSPDEPALPESDVAASPLPQDSPSPDESADSSGTPAPDGTLTPAATPTPEASAAAPQTPTPQEVPAGAASPAPSPDSVTPTPSVTPEPSITPEPSVTPTPTPEQPAAESWALAGQELLFVDLLWRTQPLDGVDAVFTGPEDGLRTVLPMTPGERGQFSVILPEGNFTQVAFYPAGQADTAQPLGGLWQLDGQPEGDAQAADFAPGTQSAFYYDSSENPSYWGAAPDYDSAAAPMTLAANGLADSTSNDPKGGDPLYFINLHAFEKDEADPLVTVEALFIQLPHSGASDPEWTSGSQYLTRTMYEVRDGVYVVPFPDEIQTASDANASGFLYEEVAFDLTRQSGHKEPFNRHYNFRGQKPSATIPDSWGTPGWFHYAAGTMDAYYYNSSVEDSYWNAHPSVADTSIHGQVIYFDTTDYGNTEYQNLGKLYLKWDNMPTSYLQYTYDPDYGFLLDTYTNNPEILYFRIPTGQDGLSENTVFTLTYSIDASSSLAGTYTFLFTFVPRSGRNSLMLDHLWEDTGEVWGLYQAQPATQDTTHIYYNNAVSAFGKVQVVFGTQNSDGSYTWMSGQEASAASWTNGHRLSVNDYSNWEKGWLNMDKPDDSQIIEGHAVPKNVWSLDQIPAQYTHVMFRGSKSATDSDSNANNFWFSPPLEISKDFNYPCFFGYRYLDGSSGQSSNDVTLENQDHNYINGRWGSIIEQYRLGDESCQIPLGTGFVNQENVYYGTSSLYDYYSLWEQSGQSITQNTYLNLRDSGGEDRWGTQGLLFNLAVSKYFEQADNNTNTAQPLYFGSGGAMTTGAWGVLLKTGMYSNYGTLYADHLYNFTNLANKWEGNRIGPVGLLDDTLNSNGDATLDGITVPYFNESFLRGENYLGITLGTAYKDLQFPFRQVTDTTDPYYGYWQFDSNKDGMRLQQDPNGSYYLNDSVEPITVNGKKSYLPFNDNPTGTATETKLNYMFGQRFDLTFTIPEGGQVSMPTADGTKPQDVVFEFQGDDDCWVFIDGQLVLDMGGIHDPVRGTINFRSGTWEIQGDLDGSLSKTKETYRQGNFHLTETADGSHTLTMLYFERGLYASNLKLTFNFPQQNELRITKEVDTSDVNPLFAEAMDSLGAFEMHLNTMATSGQPLPVNQSAGYVDTQSLVLYQPDDIASGTFVSPTSGKAQVQTDSSDQTQYLYITQPDGWDLGPPTDPKLLLTLTPNGNSVNLSDYAFLELELYNATTENRGSELYIQLQDVKGNTVTGSARALGYLGEANLFLPDVHSLVRIDLDALIGTSTFDRSNVTAVRLGLQKGTETNGHYRLYRAAFGTEWNKVLSTGFSVGDEQISDYNSLDEDGGSLGYQPANGAWYSRQTTDTTGGVIESISSVVQNGSLSLANGQTAVFIDKFRVGSYLQIEENVDPALFETTWSIHENGQPVSFNSLLYDRPDISTVQNPNWGFTHGETPLEDQAGTTPDDGRTELGFSNPNQTSEAGFVYRSYLSPDNNENLPINLEVIFHNKMRTGGFTLTKQLASTMRFNGRYPEGTYTFDIYYTNVAGRGLEQFLGTQPYVEGIGSHYIHQVVQLTTDAATGSKSLVISGIPAGTQYIIRERPSNGATLVNLAAQGANDQDAVKNVSGDDYSSAYIQDTTHLLADGQTESDLPVYTFTNENKPFLMQIQKIWQGTVPDNVEEIRIQVQRRVVNSQTENEWEPVTKDFFGAQVGEDNTIVLNQGNDWKITSEKEALVYPTSGTSGDNKNFLYEYRIVELGVGQGELACYRVEYTEIAGGNYNAGHSIVTYQARNIPTGLTLQKTWLDNQNRDNTRPDAVRVQLQRSLAYDPEQPNNAVSWETLNQNGAVAANTQDSYIELKSPDWSYTLEKLDASGTDADGQTKPYYYRLQEVQIQVSGQWVPIASNNQYEPVYSLPVTLDQAATLTVENALKTASIKVIKQDAQNAGRLLPGAKFSLVRLTQTADGTWIPDATATTATGTTGQDGTVVFKGLRPGRYRLTETKAPDGYQASLTPTDVLIGAEHLNDTVVVTVQNSFPLTFTFTKVAADNYEQTLSGAEFALFAPLCDDSGQLNQTLVDPDNPGSCWTRVNTGDVVSDQNGKVVFDGLAAGVYRLVETKAPDGYVRPTGQWQVTLNADGSTVITGIDNPPAFLADDAGLKLPNRRPMAMPSSGGPGIPLAAALGVLLMGAGLLLTGRTLRRRNKTHRPSQTQ